MKPVIENKAVSKSRRKKYMWIGSISFIALIVILCTAISVYVGLSLTKKERQPITADPSEYGLSYKDATFISRDKETKLKGWIIEPETTPKATIIMSHGYGGNRHDNGAGFLPLSKNFAEEGYRVVMFDFRNAGESEGSQTTIGVKEKMDLLGVIDMIKGETEEPIVLYGISMGAATSLLAASQEDTIKAVIADSPFSDLEAYLKENLSVWSKLPDFPFTALTLATVPFIAGLDPSEASPIQAVKDIYPRPILFIHSNGDTAIPYTESKRMVQTHPDKFKFWMPKDVKHVKGYSEYPEEYVKRVTKFLDESL
ncbi:lysophospholipase [Priestia megaterium]|nr:lysophospholipase [Priestia megaterium]